MDVSMIPEKSRPSSPFPFFGYNVITSVHWPGSFRFQTQNYSQLDQRYLQPNRCPTHPQAINTGVPELLGLKRNLPKTRDAERTGDHHFPLINSQHMLNVPVKARLDA